MVHRKAMQKKKVKPLLCGLILLALRSDKQNVVFDALIGKDTSDENYKTTCDVLAAVVRRGTTGERYNGKSIDKLYTALAAEFRAQKTSRQTVSRTRSVVAVDQSSDESSPTPSPRHKRRRTSPAPLPSPSPIPNTTVDQGASSSDDDEEDGVKDIDDDLQTIEYTEDSD